MNIYFNTVEQSNLVQNKNFVNAEDCANTWVWHITHNLFCYCICFVLLSASMSEIC